MARRHECAVSPVVGAVETPQSVTTILPGPPPSGRLLPSICHEWSCLRDNPCPSAAVARVAGVGAHGAVETPQSVTTILPGPPPSGRLLPSITTNGPACVTTRAPLPRSRVSPALVVVGAVETPQSVTTNLPGPPPSGRLLPSITTNGPACVTTRAPLPRRACRRRWWSLVPWRRPDGGGPGRFVVTDWGVSTVDRVAYGIGDGFGGERAVEGFGPLRSRILRKERRLRLC
jgi:hypothetical protein